ncbi:hypothetical protein [Paenibacillus mucilaginosus]|uniref:hypothetical protein n=1 Tax=Paenibacillus mucilaginosus TaxID=61624 RepID=UPI0005A0A185|nr:hypothetical protein [Paenibacillus mucilaginosus]MCG7218135.1 hypothetical protein [Paenibacillus mucilaginosus]
MREAIGISQLGEQTIQDFIHALTTHEDLNPKTLKENILSVGLRQLTTKRKRSYFKSKMWLLQLDRGRVLYAPMDLISRRSHPTTEGSLLCHRSKNGRLRNNL